VGPRPGGILGELVVKEAERAGPSKHGLAIIESRLMIESSDVRAGTRWPWELALTALLLAFVLVWFRPLTVWEFDEPLFSLAVTDWNPLVHQPPPPGYPLYIGVASLIRPIFGSSFHALVAMSIIGSILGFVLFSRAFSRLTGSAAAGIAGALVFYLSPTMLVHGSVAMSDPPALAFLAAALLWAFRLMASRQDHALPDLVIFAASASAAIGFRPQFSIALLPLVAFLLIWLRPWKSRLIVVATFTAVCLLWLAPLVATFGGVSRFLAWERGQAAYFALHDAGLSRGPWAAFLIAARFIAHPWGMKWLAAPILALALTGAVVLLRRRERLLVPLAVMGVPYLLFALLWMDPADGARYIIPFSLVVAALAGAGVAALFPWWRHRLAVATVLVWGGFAFLYVSSILQTRREIPSPPVSAAAWAVEALPAEGVILVQPALMPHGRFLLGSFQTMPIEEGLRKFATELETPLWMFVEGYWPRPDAAKFWWPASDAYGKVTRGHYRAVSIVPIPPAERFMPLEGVEPLELLEEGRSGRWLLKEARLVIPRLESSLVELTFYASPDSPHQEVTLSLYVDEQLRAGLPVAPARVSTARLRIPDGGLLTVVTDKTFVPAALGARDTRDLGVMLLGVRQIR
jgi:hypothetical protein